MLEDELGPCTPAGANPMPQLISWFALDAAHLPVEDWPWIMVVGRETPALTMVESIPEGDAYDVTYNVRAYAYVRRVLISDTPACQLTRRTSRHPATRSARRLSPPQVVRARPPSRNAARDPRTA
ncbi:hypothetical protein DI270_004950 [Microbispora triticiradicis]|uniref:UTRA domain-containing protein n=1 Tax=Microbispora triticiradicis TaxID=2200763 RepID=A0ABX9LQ30_9ACTN|nr:hypothetical protein [Microbispora triticiradicis]RGA06115.1 hypothetical protein DI270_004950 [Microbispora triticiradicis]GLW20479.1 hypothetical protein Mame01_05220 [Microbispora amethystogenes]